MAVIVPFVVVLLTLHVAHESKKVTDVLVVRRVAMIRFRRRFRRRPWKAVGVCHDG